MINNPDRYGNFNRRSKFTQGWPTSGSPNERFYADGGAARFDGGSIGTAGVPYVEDNATSLACPFEYLQRKRAAHPNPTGRRPDGFNFLPQLSARTNHKDGKTTNLTEIVDAVGAGTVFAMNFNYDVRTRPDITFHNLIDTYYYQVVGVNLSFNYWYLESLGRANYYGGSSVGIPSLATAERVGFPLTGSARDRANATGVPVGVKVAGLDVWTPHDNAYRPYVAGVSGPVEPGADHLGDSRPCADGLPPVPVASGWPVGAAGDGNLATDEGGFLRVIRSPLLASRTFGGDGASRIALARLSQIQDSFTVSLLTGQPEVTIQFDVQVYKGIRKARSFFVRSTPGNYAIGQAYRITSFVLVEGDVMRVTGTRIL